MATTQQSVTIGSHETALCIVPPKHLWASVDRLRMLYDKAYAKWPPHVNLIYPFVRVESLARVSDLITEKLRSQTTSDGDNSVHVFLNSADVFPHRHDNTIFICDDDESRNAKLRELRRLILRALGQNDSNYRMHMTLGQSTDLGSSPHKFILEKASLIPALEWEVKELYILVRERISTESGHSSQMKPWGTIKLDDLSLSRVWSLEFYNTGNQEASGSEETQAVPEGKRHPYIFSSTSGKWEVYKSKPSIEDRSERPDTLRVASYNVLAEFHYPPSQSRYPILSRNILDKSARSDVLVLEEVTDDFLSYLLQNDGVRNEYQFTSHGLPYQPDIDPLPSHLNVVVLSKWSFTWNWVSFQRRHKGSVVLQFDDIGKRDEDCFLPVILATVHLTCGLTEGSVAAKKIELQAIVNHLSRAYPRNPWILAGDFNITTSSYTISAALEKKAISPQTSKYLENLETMLIESGLSDSWTVARVQNADWTETEETQHQLNEAFEGEQGATFDPTVNDLAAKIVGSGFNNRPQRYDRILVKGDDFFSIQGFNMFGRRGDIPGDETDAVHERTYGSDHWGIRCTLRLMSESIEITNEAKQVDISIQPKSAQDSLSDTHELKRCLMESNVFPSERDIESRERALKILEDTLLEKDVEETPATNRSLLSFVVVPVGSYGLGVWTPSSDVDCLCIGSISSSTFFALAGQRLRRAAAKGIKILRRVNANSGTMLELEVLGIKMDLQYCPSTVIAETWPRAMKLPPNDPVFTLATQTLAKLKPARDLYYMRHTIPDFAAFRTAYQFIKTWAKRRGIHAARFGYLGGIHISILLSRICKILSRNGRPVSVPTIISTFFNHYANFDWKKDMVSDPFFHRHLRYFRAAREPMVILGFYPPSLNTATATSLPSLRTISEELQRADTLLSEEGMTWPRFLGQGNNDFTVSGLSEGAADFLKTHKSYVKIDAYFWGVSLAKGSQFVGWLESRCVMLLVDLNRRLPNIHARIWPARFVDKESSDEDKDYQGYYLIGLDEWQTDNGQPMSKDDLKVALGSLQTVLRKFEGQIRGDEKYFDTKSSWMSASVVKQSEVAGLRLDGREWGEYTIGDDKSEDEEEMETMDDNSESEFSMSNNSKTRKNDKSIPVRPEYTGKFRSSADVINRLRWDPGLESSNYIVGYEDRFLGAMERPLDQWKTEQTDEEFIPQHRILYFKRSSDGVVVWDRKSRRDDIFRSGVKKTEE